MKMLAIKGHLTRGNEVIKLLEMLGGKNRRDAVGTNNETHYFIDGDGVIDYDIFIDEDGDFVIFTIEEFLEKYPFQVMDFVRIPEYESELCILKMKWCSVSEHIEYMVCPNDEEEWFTAVELLEYNDNPNKIRDCKKCGLHFGSVQCFDKDCPHNAPKSYAVSLVGDKVIDNLMHTDIDMNTRKDSESTNSDNTICKIAYLSINNKDYADQVEIDLGDNYEYKFEMNRLYLIKKKPKYPKTYEECCKVLEWNHRDYDRVGYRSDLLCKLQVLILCRDAYWKIAGDEMGLGNPWEPKHDYDEEIFFIYCDRVNGINKGKGFPADNFILTFSTAEMRDAFYENFKDLIEGCKELL